MSIIQRYPVQETAAAFGALGDRIMQIMIELPMMKARINAQAQDIAMRREEIQLQREHYRQLALQSQQGMRLRQEGLDIQRQGKEETSRFHDQELKLRREELEQRKKSQQDTETYRAKRLPQATSKELSPEESKVLGEVMQRATVDPSPGNLAEALKTAVQFGIHRTSAAISGMGRMITASRTGQPTAADRGFARSFGEAQANQDNPMAGVVTNKVPGFLGFGTRDQLSTNWVERGKILGAATKENEQKILGGLGGRIAGQPPQAPPQFLQTDSPPVSYPTTPPQDPRALYKQYRMQGMNPTDALKAAGLY